MGVFSREKHSFNNVKGGGGGLIFEGESIFEGLRIWSACSDYENPSVLFAQGHPTMMKHLPSI